MAGFFDKQPVMGVQPSNATSDADLAESESNTPKGQPEKEEYAIVLKF